MKKKFYNVMDTTENFWVSKAHDYTELLHTLLKNVLHPAIVNLVNELKPSTYLDFGCGDGRMSALLDHNIPISIYDFSRDMISQAQQYLGERVEKTYFVREEIPPDYFDAVVCSLVLVCIDNETDFFSVLKEIKKCLSINGKAIIALTHPCFRQYDFSDHFTDFSKGKPFEYLKEGQPFNVTIHDPDGKHKVTFKDYHWSLSFTVNKMIEAGLKIDCIIETPDDFTAKEHNKQYCPFIILIASKYEK